MSHPCLQRLTPALLALLLIALGAPALAEEPQADSQETAGEKKPPANRLAWRTSTEHDNFGYNIYRGESEEGPFVRLNEDPIPGAGTTDEPTDYEYIDDTIEPAKTYWYYLESISMSGVKERFTTVFRKDPPGSGKAADSEDGSEREDPSAPE